ncbi:hypothetical protein F8M41_010072 [Gigaspora margarita]|uniref:Uncharacterized protein n=1 Tax=Gigaspora margarita TaxID=4874 RepID=A0A8H3X4G6_GIGMA|nr:hypothetical protein F8M41_010072 [Gigaspora margarita]
MIVLKKEKEKGREDKLPELPVEDFNISNKIEESYFYVGEDEERDKETTQLRQASNKKTEHEKMVSDNDDSDSKGARNKVLTLLLNTEGHSLKISETDEDSQEKKRKIIVYNYSWHPLENWDQAEADPEIMMIQDFFTFRNSELETSKSLTIGMIQGALSDDSDNNDNINKEDSNYSQ